MKAKIDVLRAVSATVGGRALLLVAIILDVVFISLFLVIWALAHFVSGWWWLGLIIYIPLLLSYISSYFICRSIIKHLYPENISGEKKQLVNDFTDKIQRVLEARGMSWPWFAVLNIKDIIFHRELRTTKELINDTTSLKKDFEELEKKLQA